MSERSADQSVDIPQERSSLRTKKQMVEVLVPQTAKEIFQGSWTLFHERFFEGIGE